MDPDPTSLRRTLQRQQSYSSFQRQTYLLRYALASERYTGPIYLRRWSRRDSPPGCPAGIWGRFTNNTTDAVIPYVGLDCSDFNLGVTYDVNVSSLKTASQSRGGIEISLIYIKKKSDGRRGVPCPRF